MNRRPGRPSSERKIRHVLIAGLAMYGVDAGVLSGIFRFSKFAGSWLIHDAGHNLNGLGRHMSEFPIEGIIANITTTAAADLLRRMRLPVVNTSGVIPDMLEFPFVGVDNRQTGRLAGEHFTGRHFRNFAVVPERGNHHYSRERVAGFVEYINRSGYGVHLFDDNHEFARLYPASPWDPRGPLCTLAQLPKPIGIYTCTDRVGHDFCRRCLRENIQIPDDVAILGTDDLEYVCETAFPPLSSIRLPAQQIGYTAARMLDCMMHGEQPQQNRVTYPALDVHVRRSTDTVAVTDALLHKALTFIREHGGKGCAAIDVIHHCGVNRRSLERRFRFTLRRTILQELQRIRVARAVSLLMETNESMPWVARTVGFRNQDHMGKTFRLVLKQHPRDIRKAFQIR